MRPKTIAPSILLAFLMFAAGAASAADPKPEAAPPFCRPAPQCSPDVCSVTKGEKAPAKTDGGPRMPEASSCTTCSADGVAGTCLYWQPAVAWLCCSKSPYENAKTSPAKK